MMMMMMMMMMLIVSFLQFSNTAIPQKNFFLLNFHTSLIQQRTTTKFNDLLLAYIIQHNTVNVDASLIVIANAVR